MRKLLLFCLLCLSPHLGLKAKNLTLVYDKYMSPYAGGEDLLTLHRSLAYAGEVLLPNRYYTDPKLAGLRAAELLLVWWPINRLMITVQHEVFGHGFITRAHKHNEVVKYSISGRSLPPFIGVAYTGSAIFWKKTNFQDELMLDIGGIDANFILANRFRVGSLHDKHIDGRMGSLYFSSSMDGWEYAMLNAPISDIEAYVRYLNYLYGTDLSRTQIKKRMWVNFIDPFLLYSWIAQMKYVSGEKGYTYPMIPFLGGGYLPAFRLHLAPYGPEWILQNFFRTPNGNPLYVYTKWGSLDGDWHWGGGIEAPAVFVGKYGSLGFKLDYFDQYEARRDNNFYNAYYNGLGPWMGVKRVKGIRSSLIVSFQLPFLRDVL